MERRREELIDYLLGELEPRRAQEVSRRIVEETEVALERDRLLLAADLIREAASEGWEAVLETEVVAEARPRRIRILRPILAAAAVLTVAVTGFLMQNGPRHPSVVYEPDVTLGYLLPEETDSEGRVPVSPTVDRCRLHSGEAEVGVIGSERSYSLKMGEEIALGSEIRTPADSAARIDLPAGGIVFVGPLSSVRIRERENGRPALRLMSGVACTVAGERPLHVGVEGSDLLLTQPRGAALVRHSPGEAICLRGELWLNLPLGDRFRVKPGRRLPAACAKAPRTIRASDDDLDLDWYRGLVYRSYVSECIEWERPGQSVDLGSATDRTLLYLRTRSTESGELRITYGGEPREFKLAKDRPFELRLKLSDLGPGPRLEVEPANAIDAARLFEAVRK